MNKLRYISYKFHYIQRCNFCKSDQSCFNVCGKRLNQSQGKFPKHKQGITTTVVQCKNCKLIFSNPQPLPLNIQDHYGIPPEDYWQENYFNVDKNYFSQELSWLKDLIDIEPGLRSLDIGAGLGKCMIALENAGFEAHGLEPSKSFHEKAIEKMKINPERLKLSSIEEVDYEKNFFDFITFGAVLEHLADPSGAILKALSWLKPNGLLHVEVPSSNWFIGKLFNTYYKLIGSDYVTNLSPMHPPYHLYEFSIDSFRIHAKQNQYEIADFRYFVCSTYLPKIVDYIVKPYMAHTNQGMQLTVWLRKPA